MGQESSPPRESPSVGEGHWIAPRWWWGGFVVLGLAALLRQWWAANSYWYDEAFAILPVRTHSYGQLVGAQPYNLVGPPLFLWMLRALHVIAGDGERVLRLPAVLAGAAALLVMVPLARQVLGRTAGVYPLALMAVCRQLPRHGCEVHSYTIDLFVTVSVLLCTVVLLRPSHHGHRRSAMLGLAIMAALAPWASFPSPFVLVAASAALAVHLWGCGGRRGWWLWVGFNALAGGSVLAQWWFHARHMYYPGLIEHWGHRGWGGFPDWQAPLVLLRWVAERPGTLGNYGTREIGCVLAWLGILGAVVLVRRVPALAVGLAGPFLLALTAALLGKYPLADRTQVFLLPCYWLLTAHGLAGVVGWARRHGRELAWAPLLLVGWDLCCLLGGLVSPDAGLDYRGAYAYVHAHERPGDVLWPHAEAVYETYYGAEGSILRNVGLEGIARVACQQRLWVVVGTGCRDLRRTLDGPAQPVLEYDGCHGLSVVLYEPKRPPGG